MMTQHQMKRCLWPKGQMHPDPAHVQLQHWYWIPLLQLTRIGCVAMQWVTLKSPPFKNHHLTLDGSGRLQQSQREIASNQIYIPFFWIWILVKLAGKPSDFWLKQNGQRTSSPRQWFAATFFFLCFCTPTAKRNEVRLGACFFRSTLQIVPTWIFM